MKILESQSAVLSNYEVLAHVKEMKARPRTTPQQHTNVQTVLKEVNDYLDPKASISQAHGRSPMPPFYDAGYEPATVTKLVERLRPYQLEKSEMLMILNLRPLEIGLLDCIIEECDERFTPEQQEEILTIIVETVGQEASHHQNGTVNGSGAVDEGASGDQMQIV